MIEAENFGGDILSKLETTSYSKIEKAAFAIISKRRVLEITNFYRSDHELSTHRKDKRS